MAEKEPTTLLKEEHRFIQEVVAAMVVLADRLDTGRQVKAEILSEVVEFMRTLVAGGHEKKEEIHLFPALQRRGVSVHSVPTRLLVEEHRRAAALVAKLEEAAGAYLGGTGAAREPLMQSLRGLAALYPLHIWQEDLLLFHQAKSALTPEDNQELLRGFGAVEEATGGDLRGRLERLAEKVSGETW